MEPTPPGGDTWSDEDPTDEEEALEEFDPASTDTFGDGEAAPESNDSPGRVTVDERGASVWRWNTEGRTRTSGPWT